MRLPTLSRKAGAAWRVCSTTSLHQDSYTQLRSIPHTWYIVSQHCAFPGLLSRLLNDPRKEMAELTHLLLRCKKWWIGHGEVKVAVTVPYGGQKGPGSAFVRSIAIRRRRNDADRDTILFGEAKITSTVRAAMIAGVTMNHRSIIEDIMMVGITKVLHSCLCCARALFRTMVGAQTIRPSYCVTWVLPQLYPVIIQQNSGT